MTDTLHTIELVPHGRQIKAAHGQLLIDAFKASNILLRSDCGGKGKCGKCRLELIDPETRDKQEILACTFPVESSLTIEIPQASLFSTHTLGKAAIELPETFSEKFSGTAPTPEDRFGVAVDLGTTTMAVYLCNMTCGQVAASAVIKNPQALYGDDVMTRISAVGTDPANLGRLQGLVTGALDQGIRDILNGKSFTGIQVEKMVVVGNPAMIHIFSGVDPASIGVAPYKPAFYSARTMVSTDLGFTGAPFSIQTLPQVSGFIGGDILSAAVAVDLPSQPAGTMLIDLGTNGELILKSENGFWATSCATGPAFEGATLACAMQALPGAVNRVVISSPDSDAGYECVPARKNHPVKPGGICGSGVVSAVAQLLKQHIIEPDGAFNPESASPGLEHHATGYRYTIVPESAESKQAQIYINQKDIRSVQLGKGALITGINFLMKRAGITRPDKLIIAGAFGAHLSVDDMLAIGMIPDSKRIESAGNAAGTGAIMALCSDEYLETAKKIAGTVQVVDLACDPEFHDEFVEQLSFPELVKPE